jgi:2-aminoadipate transaminase
MTAPAFDFERLYGIRALPPAPRFAGFPPYMFVGGNNDPDMIPVEGLIAATEAVLRRDGRSLAIYNLGMGPQGYPPLRDFVATKVATDRGIRAGADDVIITSGSNQGLDMIGSLLLDPGDTVLVEEFCYAGAMATFRRLGAELAGMALDAEGIVIEALAAQLDAMAAAGRPPKLIYTIPTIQNPTGSILPLQRRHALLALARRHGVPVLEDECYADLLFGGVAAPPALYALDPAIVMHVGSFSKSLAPALRLGYIVADAARVARLLPQKRDSGTGALDQMIVAEYFSRHFRAHVDRLNGVLQDKLATMVEAVEREFGADAECWRPSGGIFLWIRLPDAVDVRALVKPAAEAGIQFNPGPEWAVDAAQSKSHLRLCFAMPDKATIRAGVAELARVCYEQTGRPARSANVPRAARPAAAD